MCAADQIHVMLVQELLNDVSTESERHTTVVLAPARRLFVGVGPQQIAQLKRDGKMQKG